VKQSSPIDLDRKEEKQQGKEKDQHEE